MPVEVPTAEEFEVAVVALNAKIDAQAMPQNVKDALKVVLEYFLQKVTTI